MLSIANVSAGGQAASYYEEKDDYYTKNPDDRDGSSKWLGNASNVSDLSGEVKAADFESALSGKMTDGSRVHIGGGKRRGGTDLTFSVPKSVSIQALVLGDHRIVDAQNQAVARAIEYLESHARTRGGEVTGNLMVGSFTHTLNRNGDPQLHTHNVAINATLTRDGVWKALDNKFMYDMKMTIGALYRAELARELQELGYGIRRTHADGRFELAGYSDMQIQEFSTRSRDIEAALVRRGLSRDSASAKVKSATTKSTRKAKKDVDREVLREVWREKAAVLNIHVKPSHDRPVPAPRRTDPEWWKSEPGPVKSSNLSSDAKASVEFALSHLTEREAVVEKSKLIRFALEHGTGRVSAEEVLAEISRRTRDGEVFEHRGEVANRKDIVRERDILRVNLAGQSAFPAGLANVSSVEAALTAPGDFPLNAGQQEAIRLITLSTDRLVGIQGRAGTGKTTMLATVKRIAEENDVQVIGLAPAGKAALELKAAGIDGITVARFLITGGDGVRPGDLIVVDEAGMLSARDMQKLLRTAEDRKARVALVGDTQQLKAVEAGRPFDQLIRNGMQTVVMDEIQRQLNRRFRESVALAAEGRVLAALSMVEKNVCEVPDDGKRYLEIAKGYTGLSSEEREKTMIVAGTNKARSSINTAVRENLGLSGKGYRFDTLSRLDFTRAQLKRTEYYLPGVVLQAERDLKSLGIAKGEQLVVIDTECISGKVRAQRADGEVVTFTPSRTHSFSIYEKNGLEVSVGDKLQLTKAINEFHIKNREFASVVAVDPARREMTLRFAGGRNVTLSNDKHLHIDHGYASTIYSAQGVTVDRILVDLDTKTKATNDAAFYVGISRGKRSLRIYTDAKGKLPAAVTRSSAKRAALELPEKFRFEQARGLLSPKRPLQSPLYTSAPSVQPPNAETERKR